MPVEPGLHTAERVIVVKDSGPVIPQESEQYDISRAGVRFRRAGETASTINAGEWEIEPDAAALTLLFERLGAVDCTAIRQILPTEVPDGGGSASYEVRYDDGSTCDVWYREGITYTGAEPLVEAVEEFLATLALPTGTSGPLVAP